MLVIFISSRSFILPLFSAVCIIYVLGATAASVVFLGWELGFIESVCFAILVGIASDFVMHFSHAYIHLPGYLPRRQRTKHALLHMGPSILAAALTTVSSASLMIFCKNASFTKFATIMMFTILHSTIGSFVVYLVLVNLFGPAEPTKVVDGMLAVFIKNERSRTPDELELTTDQGEHISSIEKKEITQNDRRIDAPHDLPTPESFVDDSIHV